MTDIDQDKLNDMYYQYTDRVERLATHLFKKHVMPVLSAHRVSFTRLGDQLNFSCAGFVMNTRELMDDNVMRWMADGETRLKGADWTGVRRVMLLDVNHIKKPILGLWMQDYNYFTNTARHWSTVRQLVSEETGHPVSTINEILSGLNRINFEKGSWYDMMRTQLEWEMWAGYGDWNLDGIGWM